MCVCEGKREGGKGLAYGDRELGSLLAAHGPPNMRQPPPVNTSVNLKI